MYALIGGAALFVWMVARGIPWWVAMPAGILCVVALFMVAVGALYTYTKVQYPSRAEKAREKVNKGRGKAKG
jgi:membrane protein YdbS with pleckstrin-like domain